MTYLADLGFWYGPTCSQLCDGSKTLIRIACEGLGPAAGYAHLSRSLIFNGGCSCAASAKGWDAALEGSMVRSHSTCTGREGARNSGRVSQSECFQKSMVEKADIEDEIPDGTATEAVAISAESLPQTFFFGADPQLACRDYQPQAGANDARRPVPSEWPARSLPAGESPMRWQSFELPSRFSMNTLICAKGCCCCLMVLRLEFSCNDHNTHGFVCVQLVIVNISVAIVHQANPPAEYPALHHQPRHHATTSSPQVPNDLVVIRDHYACQLSCGSAPTRTPLSCSEDHIRRWGNSGG